MKLSNDQGIVSYNLGGHGNTMATNYWVIKNALEHTTPKLVVIDCMNLEADEKTSGEFAYVHLSFDAFPLNLTKIRGIWDLLDDPVMDQQIAERDPSERGEKRSKIALLWDYSVYHRRWKELCQDDFQLSPTLEKGAEARTRVAVPSEWERVSKDGRWSETVSMDYLRRSIKECQDRGIEVLLTYLPFPANEVQQLAANNAIDIASEMGVNYVNFLDLNLVDFDTDCYDEASHLNPSGGRKVTKYLGEYIKEHYEIPDRRVDERYSAWTADYINYQFYMLNMLFEQEQMDSYLALLADDMYKVSVDVRDDSVENVFPYSKLINSLDLKPIEDGWLSNWNPGIIALPRHDDYSMRIVVTDAASEGVIDDTYWYYSVNQETNQIETMEVVRN